MVKYSSHQGLIIFVRRVGTGKKDTMQPAQLLTGLPGL